MIVRDLKDNRKIVPAVPFRVERPLKVIMRKYGLLRINRQRYFTIIGFMVTIGIWILPIFKLHIEQIEQFKSKRRCQCGGAYGKIKTEHNRDSPVYIRIIRQ